MFNTFYPIKTLRETRRIYSVKAMTNTLRLELSPNHLGRSPSVIPTIANSVQRAHMLLCEQSCLKKQYHQLFPAKGTSWGNFSVCYWQITQPFIECIQRFIDLLTGQLKNRLKILIVVSILQDNLPNIYN